MRSEPISEETILRIHDEQIEEHGGANGVRDENALLAALASPWSGFGNHELYPSTEEKASRLCYEIITQHPFVDGNKRTGLMALLIVLLHAGKHLDARHSSLISLAKSVAAGEMDYAGLLDFIRRHIADRAIS